MIKVLQELMTNTYDPNIATIIKDDADVLSLIPDEFKDYVSEICKINPVSNLRWDYLFFNNSKVFSPAAQAFKLNKSNGNAAYTIAPSGTQEYIDFWITEKKRCIDGYEVGGVRISGEHYFYLNYCQIEKKIKLPSGRTTKILDFPDFTSMDYYWFLELEYTENPEKFGGDVYDKKPMILAKARRKGWSFKNAAGVAWIYSFFEKSRCVILSEEGIKAKQTFDMFYTNIEHLNKYTEFRQAKLVDSNDFVKAGWTEQINGIDTECGSLNEVEWRSLKNTPNKASGLSTTRILFEEAGEITNLKQAYRFSEPTIRDGEIYTGLILIYGTGGDMTSMTQDFADMFLNPDSYNLKCYSNIYENGEKQNSKCGFFISEMWYRPGGYLLDSKGNKYESVDENGNPLHWVAEILLDKEREKAKSSSQASYETLISQKCKTPSEAFLRPQGNVFPVAMLYERVKFLMSNDRYKIFPSGVLEWTRDPEKPVRFKPTQEVKPIYFYPHKSNESLKSAVIIYESPPVESFPQDLYKIGIDPVRFDKSGGKSLFSVLVYKQLNNFDTGVHSTIVAEYTGRNDLNDLNNEIALQLSLYYGNAEVMCENEAGQDLFNYFKRKGYSYLLATQPDSIIKREFQTTRVARTFGSPMHEKMKALCEKLTLNWLLEKRGINEDGQQLYNLDFIPSVGLLQELVSYTRHANCDRVMALFQLILVIEENAEKEVSNNNVQTTVAQQFLKRLNNFR